MTPEDLVALDTRLKALYGEQWPGLPPAMLLLWLDALRAFEVHTLKTAVMQWARQHTFRVPGLDDVVTRAIAVDDAAATARARQLARLRPDTPRAPGAITVAESGAGLADAAATTPHDQRTWAQLHVQLVLKGVCVPSRYAEAAFLCERYAEDYPHDADAWRQEAAWWRGGAGGEPGTVQEGLW